jgi:hypothetical protein
MAYIGNTADQQAFTPAIDYFNKNIQTYKIIENKIKH